MHGIAWPLGPPDLRDSRGPWSSGCLMEVWFVLCGSDIALSVCTHVELPRNIDLDRGLGMEGD